MTQVPITAIILTHNEQANLPACLASIAGWTREVIVVDSGSTDGTLEIATAYRATVAHHPFETHAQQWTWALNHLPIATDWVLGLDADQRVTRELRDELMILFSPSQVKKGKSGKVQKGKAMSKQPIFPFPRFSLSTSSLINLFPGQGRIYQKQTCLRWTAST